ncbi:hypothetical protein, partial [Novosphingobium sp.]|uniref:hypothetical protein n=1 Tax=Novosphingobium sp. TaxID=1874826 RepID=UPI00286A2270
SNFATVGDEDFFEHLPTPTSKQAERNCPIDNEGRSSDQPETMIGTSRAMRVSRAISISEDEQNRACDHDTKDGPRRENEEVPKIHTSPASSSP